MVNGLAVAQSRLSTNQRVGGLIPGSSSVRVAVSWSKILNPKSLPMAVSCVCEFLMSRLALCGDVTVPFVCVKAHLCCLSTGLYKYSPLTL